MHTHHISQDGNPARTCAKEADFLQGASIAPTGLLSCTCMSDHPGHRDSENTRGIFQRYSSEFLSVPLMKHSDQKQLRGGKV